MQLSNDLLGKESSIYLKNTKESKNERSLKDKTLQNENLIVSLLASYTKVQINTYPT